MCCITEITVKVIDGFVHKAVDTLDQTDTYCQKPFTENLTHYYSLSSAR